MAIQFARIETVSRSSGDNACRKGAYNARTRVKDYKTNITYNYQDQGSSVYSQILLPEYVDQKFANVEALMNLVEASEKRKDSQLLKAVILALPDDKELTLEDRIEITHRLIAKREWVKEGLGVQIDIHHPEEDKSNWYANLLITTRRFSTDGQKLAEKKAIDLNPEFRNIGKRGYIVAEGKQIHSDLKDIINNYFKELGLKKQVDAISLDRKPHIGPRRIYSIFNQVLKLKKTKQIAESEHLTTKESVSDTSISTFNMNDLKHTVKCVVDEKIKSKATQ